MDRTLFKAPLAPHGEHHVTVGDTSASWNALNAQAQDLARSIAPGRCYLIEPKTSLQTFVHLLAVCQTPDASLIWGPPQALGLDLNSICDGLHLCAKDTLPRDTGPTYATLTSGSSGRPKIALGKGDTLGLVALQYDAALYRGLFAGATPDVVSTNLPLDYSAAFMMLVLPALFHWYEMEIFEPHRWDRLVQRARNADRVVCLSVPSLLTAAAVSHDTPVSMRNTVITTTAGYLARPRIEAVRTPFQDVRLACSYGATETGVMTLDDAPDGKHFHVGRPIMGKSVWIEDPDGHGSGKIATNGPDARDAYLGTDEKIRRNDGSVAITDFGHFDKQGNLYLDGRIDGGEKLHGLTIYPRRIERHILALDGVEDVKVSVLAEAGSGLQRLTAQVIGTVGEDIVRAHCATLPAHTCPSTISCRHGDADGVYSGHGKLRD